MRPNRILWFDSTGSLIEEATSRRGLLTRIQSSSEDVLAQFEKFRGSKVTVTRISSYQVEKPLFTYESGPSVSIEPSEGPSFTLPSPFRSRTIWTFLEGSRIARLQKGKEYVEIVNFEEETLKTLSIPKSNYDVNEKDGEAWIYRQLNPNQMAFGKEDPFRKTREKALETLRFPDKFPPALDILPDADQGIWLLRADKHTGQIWTHLRAKHPPRTIEFPSELRISAFGKKYVVARTRGKKGIELVKLYKRDQVLNHAE